VLQGLCLRTSQILSRNADVGYVHTPCGVGIPIPVWNRLIHRLCPLSRVIQTSGMMMMIMMIIIIIRCSPDNIKLFRLQCSGR
jgi:hypothetical protein